MEQSVDYSRQASLIDTPDCVHVIGCGGVGTWAALMLALAGVPKLHLYDHDMLTETNLNRLPYSPAGIGKSKVELLSKSILRMRPECEVISHARFEPLLHMFEGYSVVIGAVDTMRDRQTIYRICQRDGARYIDVGAEQHHCTISPSPADWPLAEDRPGYFTPIWIAPVVVAAGLAVSAACHGLSRTVNLDLQRMEVVSVEEGVDHEPQA